MRIDINSFKSIASNHDLKDQDEVKLDRELGIVKSNQSFGGRAVDLLAGTRREESKEVYQTFKMALDGYYRDGIGVKALNSVKSEGSNDTGLTKEDISRTISLAERLESEPTDKHKDVIDSFSRSHEEAIKRQAFSKGDPIRGAALDSNRPQVEADFNRGFGKIRSQILSYCNESGTDGVSTLLAGTGRDKKAYAFFTSGNMLDMLKSWKPDEWSMAKSAGFLADISLNLRDAKALFPTKHKGQYAVDKKYSEIPKEVRKQGGAARENFVRQGDWAQNVLPENTPVKMGISSTTGVVLELIARLNDPQADSTTLCTDEEVEAITNGLMDFWDSGIKQLSGEYHTAAEVWATYNNYLMEDKQGAGQE